jgi:predicted ABC-type ATPase
VARDRGRIVVIAGVNGAGKSSVLGATINQAGGAYFNPDEETRALLEDRPSLTLAEANSLAWQLGKRGLERSIENDTDFTLETTLGGRTITGLLQRAADKGLEVIMRYVGLDSPERHIARVAARVNRGGHFIDEARIRQRYTASREHLILLLPHLADLIVFDNSLERDPEEGEAPEPRILLEMEKARIRFVPPIDQIPAWARPVVAAAIERDRHGR